jgi:hypothetical protein
MKRTMREVFGLDKLRPGQVQLIRSVLEGIKSRLRTTTSTLEEQFGIPALRPAIEAR